MNSFDLHFGLHPEDEEEHNGAAHLNLESQSREDLCLVFLKQDSQD